MTTTTTAICKLTRPCQATGIHGVTGRPYVEGPLDEGTLCRQIVTRETEGGAKTTFEASSDEGRSWYLNETYEDARGLFEQIGPLTTITRKGVTYLVPADVE